MLTWARGLATFVISSILQCMASPRARGRGGCGPGAAAGLVLHLGGPTCTMSGRCGQAGFAGRARPGAAAPGRSRRRVRMSAAISLLLPTRGRPDQARQMLQTVCATAADPAQIEVVLYLDRDDVPSHGLDHPGLRVTRLIEPRATMGAMTAAC